MTKQAALQKIAQYLEEEESLLLMSDPDFRQAIAESEADVKAGRLKTLNQVIKELGLKNEDKAYSPSRKRSQKAR